MPRTEMEVPEIVAASDPEEVEFYRGVQKKRMKANMKFIGNLFLRQMLTAKTVGNIVLGLLEVEDAEQSPAEHILECTCELLMAIGLAIEAIPAGKQVVGQVVGCLMDLKQRKDKRGKAVYCKRLQFTVQDIIEARANNWQKKSFKETAKTKEEIRQEHQREIQAQAAGGRPTNGDLRPGGLRPGGGHGGRP
eukprot:CAMPEP_0172763068 /NCGR_PEP_ID=MMETSP1074-20121228/174652_1 /TAXON_ID=2916 /ORGANISM="Ceratium fusus, Strain PA161109" /LENGTH=191 /DNA_ID=CAMNT_0013597577 /DNA_START=1 /DNA_END=576 /DNA_ORIENTATION=-